MATVHSLSDELLQQVLHFVPELAAETDCGIVIGSRGAVEGVCRRWRRLSISMCSWVQLDCSFVPGSKQIAGLPGLLQQHLAGRSPSRLDIVGWPRHLQFSQLAAVLPALKSLILELEGQERGLLAILPAVGAAPCCTGLEELQVAQFPYKSVDGLDVAVEQSIRSLPGLKRLKLCLSDLPEQVAAAVAALPALEACTITVSNSVPEEAALSCLRRLGPKLASLVLECPCSNKATACAQLLPALAELANAGRIGLVLKSAPSVTSIRGLDRIPALRGLALFYFLPKEAWLLSSLSILCLSGVPAVSVPGNAGRGLPALRELVLDGCGLDRWAAPPPLCTCPQLSVLEVVGCTRQRSSLFAPQNGPPLELPSQLSALAVLERADFCNTPLETASLSKLGSLSRLTHLSLAGTQISSLPPNTCPPTLRALELQRNSLSPPLPHALGRLTALRGVGLSLPLPAKRERLAVLQTLLRQLPHLRVLGVEWTPAEQAAKEPAAAPASAAAGSGDEEEELEQGTARLSMMLAVAGLPIKVQQLDETCSMAQAAQGDVSFYGDTVL